MGERVKRSHDVASADSANKRAQPAGERGPSQWDAVLDSFTTAHEGWLVTVDVWTDSVRRAVADHEPLRWVRRVGDGIEIAVGDRPAPIRLQVAAPARVRMDVDDTGAHRGLTIVSYDGTVTCVRFRVATLPEETDDLLDREVSNEGG